MALPGRRALVVALVVALVASTAGAQVFSTVTGRPDVEAFAPDSRLAPGEETTLDVLLVNRGEVLDGGRPDLETLVRTARVTTVRVGAGDAPVEVLTGETPVGTVPPGVSGPVPVRVRVAENATPGTYELRVRLSYEYVERVQYNDEGRERRFTEAETDRTSVAVRVERRPRFELVGVDSDVAVGEAGPVRVTLRNVGAPARDATVALRSADAEVGFGGGTAVAESFVGDWPAGEARTVAVRARVADDALVREYALSARVAYRTTDGRSLTSGAVAVGLRPAVGPALAVVVEEASLPAGREGVVRGRVENRGDAVARDVTLRLAADSERVTLVETAYPLGDVPPGGSVPFAAAVDVASDADPGPRRLAATVERRTDDDGRRAEAADLRVRVVDTPEPFAADALDARVVVGGDARLRVRLTNAGDGAVRDVRARIEPTEPFESEDPAAFVPALAPGASANLSFHLSASDEAVPGTNAVELRVAYEDADGDDRTAGPLFVPVDVVPEPAGSALLPAVVALAALVAFGGWYWRRR